MSIEDLNKQIALNTNNLTDILKEKQSLENRKQERKLKAIDTYKRKFEAAAYNRLNSSWANVDFSPAQELFNDLPVLKVRSRDLYCNSPVVNNFVSLMQQNVIGNKGFTFKSWVPNAKNGFNKKICKQIEDLWYDFCKKGNFEVTGQYSLNDSLDLMMQSLSIDGEILFKKVIGKGKYGFQVQLLHSEQLIVTKHELFDMGIKRDQYGAPIEYCLTTHHPGEGLLRYVYEPAFNIVHVYIPYQIGAPRGVPMTASVMQTIKMLDEYRKAELVAARIEASKFVVYTQKQPDDLDPEIAMETAIPATQRANTIQPGMAEVLPPGVDAKYLASTHPNTAFEAFNKSLKKEIAAGIGLSYNSLYSDFENTSFSSMRAAFISERAFYRKIQNLFIEKILGPIFETFLDAAILSGKLKLDPVLDSYDFYKQYEFIAKAYEFSNPLQEAEAQKLLVESRIMSRSQICAERGTTYEDVLDDIKNEQELEKTKGIRFEVLPKSSIVTPVPEDSISTPLAGQGNPTLNAPASSTNSTNSTLEDA